MMMNKVVAIRGERSEIQPDTITRINVPVEIVGEKIKNFSFKFAMSELENEKKEVLSKMNNVSKDELITAMTEGSESDYSFVFGNILNGNEMGSIYDQARSEGKDVRDAIDFSAKRQIEMHLQKDSSVALRKVFLDKSQDMDFWQAFTEAVNEIADRDSNNYLGLANLIVPKAMLDMREIVYKITEETTEVRKYKKAILAELEKGEKLFITCPRELIDTLFIDSLCKYDNYKGAFISGLKDELSHVKTVSYAKGKLLVGSHNSESYQRLVNAYDIMIIDNGLVGDNAIRKIVVNSGEQDNLLAKDAVEINNKRNHYLSSFSGFSAQTLDGHSLDLAVSISPGDKIVLDDYYGTVGLVRNEIGLTMHDNIKTCLSTKHRTYSQVISKNSRADIVSRLSDITQDKSDNANSYQSVRFLLNTREGRKILVRDILVDLALSGLREFTPTSFEPGSISILLPNIQTSDEIKEVKRVSGYCKKALKGEAYDATEEWIDLINESIAELRESGIKDNQENLLIPKTGPIRYDENMRIGAMIENPFAVRDAEEIRKHVDYYTIGLNDITWYHHVLFKVYPEFFEESKFTQLEEQDNEVFNGFVLKKDVGSKLVNEGSLEEIARVSGIKAETIKSIFEEAGICDTQGRLLKTYQEIQKLDFNIDSGVLLSVAKKVLSRLAIGVDDIPGRENSQDYHEENMNFNPRILRTLAYAIKHFQSLDSTNPLQGGKFIEVCGDIPVKLIPFFIALKQKKVSVYSNQLQFIKLFVRNITYEESRKELLSILKDEKTNNGVFNRLDRMLGEFQDLFQLEAEPEYITKQLRQHESDLAVIQELNQKAEKHRVSLLGMNESNYAEVLSREFGYKKPIHSFTEALYVFQSNVLREILNVSRIRTYSTVKKGNKEFVRALYSSLEEGSSRFSGELVEGNKLRLRHYYVETKSDGTNVPHYIIDVADILEDEQGQYIILSAETGQKKSSKRINILVDNGDTYFELMKDALHKEAIEYLDIGSGLPNHASEFTDMLGKTIAYYTSVFKRNTMQVERNLHDVQLEELRKVIDNDDVFATVEQFLFGEKFVMEIFREGEDAITKKPTRRTVIFTDNAYSTVEELINKINLGQKLTINEDGECCLDGKKLALMDDREDVFRARVNNSLKIRDLTHTKLLQEEEKELLSALRQAEAEVRIKHGR
ncbi:MAG: hypothetical protein PHF25_04230 [Candidatus Margulisbacteria bacterium]|nr:hypothetical protein [Candidatus Margulisiibacteriota bacterium]